MPESYEVVGNERPDQIAAHAYGDPTRMRLLMAHNNIDDPLNIPAGTLLDVPPLEVLETLM
jgi:nucleoid-associated protein YgaU